MKRPISLPYFCAALLVLAACDSPRRSESGEVSSASLESAGTPASVAANVSSASASRQIANTDELKAVEAAIDSGQPWIATQRVSPILADARRRTPAALLLAARAAAGWRGWDEVDKLLSREQWIDTAFDGQGRELLAQSALERGADTSALIQASLAVRDTRQSDARGRRLVYLARALERNSMFDSAAVVYADAGKLLHPIQDWLSLRVAGVQRDPAQRAERLTSVSLPPARARVGWTDAQARERFGDFAGAAKLYAALGATVPSLRLRLTASTDDATRRAIEKELLSFIGARGGSADARLAVDVLDQNFHDLTPEQELNVARSAAVSGPLARALSGFSRASAHAALFTPAIQLQYALALSRAGRNGDAISHLDAVTGPLAATAAYQRARVLLTSGTASATRAALRRVPDKFPNDTAASSSALFLLADLSSDDGNDDQARALYRRLYREYPTSSRAGDARFHAAIIALVNDQSSRAATEFDSLVAVFPRADDANAARYWAGRAWAAAGNAATAKARWRSAIAQDSASYYAMLAARRLGDQPWQPAARAGEFAPVGSVDQAIARAALLERLGMDVEARFEYAALEDAASAPSASIDLLGATAQALVSRGQTSRSIRLARKLVDRGQRDARAYRLLYPLLYRGELERTAKAHSLAPSLVAGLIRQESNFYPGAVSVADARGLMQVLPAVGRDVARSEHFPVWYSVLLTDPDANLQLGTAHLAAYMKQYGPLPRVLAAYNAGGSRVKRWATKRGMDDPDIFTERIPFAETRNYVRIVQRNTATYRALYW